MKLNRHTYGIVISEYKTQLKQDLIVLLLVLGLFYVYIILGAFLFFYTEHCRGVEATRQITTEIERMAIDICEEMVVSKNDSLLYHEYSIDELKNVGCNESYSVKTNKCILSQGNIEKWVGFTIALCYTIGYGTVVPVTDLGKIICIIFMVPGISIAILLYTKAGRILIVIGNATIVYIEIKIISRDLVTRLVFKNVIFQLLLFICIFTCHTWLSIMADKQQLSHFDAIYFSFTTLTTIGFGDIDFELTRNPVYYVIAYSITLHCGLGLLASILMLINETLTQKQLISTLRRIKHKTMKDKKRRDILRYSVANQSRHRYKTPAERQCEITFGIPNIGYGIPVERRTNLVPYLAYADIF